MILHTHEFSVDGTGGTDITDVTDETRLAVAESGIRQGTVTVFTPGSTAAVTTIEYESGVVQDLQHCLERLVPEEQEYLHDRRWGDGNGYSHVRAALVGPSLTVPVVDGELVLGTWQQVVVLDFDNRPRGRRVLAQVVGTD